MLITEIYSSAWAIHGRHQSHIVQWPGWIVTVTHALGATNLFAVVDDYGYLVEVPAPWLR